MSGIPSYQIVEFLLIAMVAVLAGVVQAMNTRVFSKNNQLYSQGNTITLISWIALVLIRLGINFASHHIPCRKRI